MNEFVSSFLKECYLDNQQIYQDKLEGENWDIIIITATNKKQAKSYRRQIDERKTNGFLSKSILFLVIPDPGNKLVGSGLSTVFTLYQVSQYLSNNTDNIFKNKRILIIHSGGNSKRIPIYSICGKLFINVPREMPDGRVSSLFDELLISLTPLTDKMKEGVLIACGDILPIFNVNQVNFDNHKDIIGLSMKKSADIGTNHGVFISDQYYQVQKYLQKASIKTLQESGAVDEQGMVYLDTGLIWINPEIASKMIDLICQDNKLDEIKWSEIINNNINLNLYSDFLPLFTRNIDYEKYQGYNNNQNNYVNKFRQQIWEVFKDDQMYLECLSPAEFIHFGTIKNYYNIYKELEQYSYFNWEKKVISFNDYNIKESSIVRTYLGDRVQLGKNVIIENSYLNCNCSVGNNSIISNLYSEYDFIIKENVIIQQVPVELKKGEISYVTFIFGLYDKPKEENGTFMNQSWSMFIKGFNLSVEDIWMKGSLKTLWNAKIYPVCPSREESLEIALYLQIPQKIDQLNLKKWKDIKKVSFNESCYLGDSELIKNQQLIIEDLIISKNFYQKITRNKWYKKEIKEITNNKNRLIKRIKILLRLINQDNNYFNKMRIYRALAELLKDCNITSACYNFLSLEKGAFESLNELFDNKEDYYNQNKYIYKKVVLHSAARVNFAGEFSDTPPYCLENGGTVINAAISLKGKLPIKVIIEVIDKPVIECISRDLGLKKTYRNRKELFDFRNPAAPFVLLKASLFISGIIKERDNISLEDVLRFRGGGLRITTDIAIPKGSGLGTSSILGGTIIKGLKELMGFRISEGELFEFVLELEQLLTTGGGWQDQVGGLIPGIKLITTKPGIRQAIQYEEINLDVNLQSQLKRRYVLIYTGQSRLARKNLRRIMGEYLLNNPFVLSHLFEIQKLAVLMKLYLNKGDIDGLAKLMNEHYDLNKKLNLGLTNRYIEQIFNICHPYIAGRMTCGAGGGGFIQVILKDSVTKKDLCKRLKEIFTGSKLEVWNAEIADKTLVMDKTIL